MPAACRQITRENMKFKILPLDLIGSCSKIAFDGRFTWRESFVKVGWRCLSMFHFTQHNARQLQKRKNLRFVCFHLQEILSHNKSFHFKEDLRDLRLICMANKVASCRQLFHHVNRWCHCAAHVLFARLWSFLSFPPPCKSQDANAFPFFDQVLATNKSDLLVAT